MASSYSFDIVSTVDLQEVDNAINQAVKEISQRYDFKGCKAEITLNNDEVKLLGQDDYKLKAMKEILHSKFIKRGVSVKSLDYSKVEEASMGTVRQSAKILNGIEKEKAKEISKDIKNSKIKVTVQIMDNQLRVSGKDKDSLQEVISLVKGKDYGIDVQFTNYR